MISSLANIYQDSVTLSPCAVPHPTPPTIDIVVFARPCVQLQNMEAASCRRLSSVICKQRHENNKRLIGARTRVTHVVRANSKVQPRTLAFVCMRVGLGVRPRFCVKFVRSKDITGRRA